MFILSQAWDKEKSLSPQQDLNLQPYAHRLDALTTEPKERLGWAKRYGLVAPQFSYVLYFFKGVKEGYLECKQPQYLRRAYKWTTSYFVLM